MSKLLRNIPSVNELLERPELKKLVDRVSHNVVADGVRNFLDNMREEVQSAASEMKVPSPKELAQRIANWISTDETPALRPVINATGILLHTGLGRAPLAKEAIDAIVEVGAGYSSVEVDLKSGHRSQRVLAVEKLLKQLTGAEAAVVVNNNAAATLLTLTALAAEREVIVSRGELVEIGGSFRLPDVMSSSGALLREVGTTNKTRIGDYAEVIGEQTAALMRVHTSNYLVVGFTQAASLAELISLGGKHDLPVIDDIGSGALVDLAPLGVQGEPLAAESIRAGADVVLFSGDKLLGGPQCGIIVGKKSAIEKIAKHPMMRALRVDKITLAALAATLRLYRDEEKAKESVPLLSMLCTSVENLKNRAERLAPQLAIAPAIDKAEPIEDVAYLGGGSVPTQEIATWCIALTPAEGNVDSLAAALRTGVPAVFGRVKEDRLLLDLRSVQPREDIQLAEAIGALGGEQPESEAEAEEESG